MSTEIQGNTLWDSEQQPQGSTKFVVVLIALVFVWVTVVKFILSAMF